MAKYLKKFKLTAQYEEYINSDIALLPNVSLTNDNNKVHYNPVLNYLTFTAEEDNSTISLNSMTSPDIKYSLNGGVWTQWDYSAITLNAGDVVRMKGNNSNGFSTDEDNINKFQMIGKISASGNIMSLLYEDNFEGKLTIPRGCCFFNMFDSCTSLTTAPELPATTLADSCYNGMFNGCTSLTTAPKLPATKLADSCYTGMFTDCTSLTTAPELPATTLSKWCYDSMFYGCTSLTTAPKLPVTTLVYSCYSSMFAYCTSLTTAPKLPATTLAGYCYYQMFSDCTNLITVPDLPATILADYCYFYMFNGCTSLTTAPKLSATTLAPGCYSSMFDGCTSLTTAPKLSATTLANQCYYDMFNGCTSLKTAPELPATTLANGCYQYMFRDCTSLTTAPELPATMLSSNCYNSMFYGCTSLTTVPKLPATTLTSYCYYYMFYRCTRLNSITCLATNIISTSCTYNWVSGVASSGTFTKAESMTSWTNGANGIPMGWTIENVHDYSTDYLTFVTLEDGTFRFTQNDLQYSLDNGTTWTTLAANTTSPTVTAGNKIMWKQTGLTPNSSNGIGIFSATGNFNVQGNVMSLLYGDDFLNKTTLSGKNYAFRNLFNGNAKVVSAENLVLPATTLANQCYYRMFYRCTSLTTAPELPATTLANDCYADMFAHCRNLTTAPKLPATKLADSCYTGMFTDCTSLTTAPELPATTLADYCYDSMFFGCTSLTTAPKLPATTLTLACYYNMFYDCTSLTTAPELPATTLADYCYAYMFDGCTSLTTAPELPATTLANYCYADMFYYCNSLKTAPELPATTLADSCYDSMFYGCTSLNYIKMLATDISGYNCLANWVKGVANTGTFIKHPNMNSLIIGDNGIPDGWDINIVIDYCKFSIINNSNNEIIFFHNDGLYSPIKGNHIDLSYQYGENIYSFTPEINLLIDIYKVSQDNIGMLKLSNIIWESEVSLEELCYMYSINDLNGILIIITLIDNKYGDGYGYYYDYYYNYNPVLNYLTFTAEEDNSTIALNSANNPDIKYSLNGGAWTQWDYSAITLNTGDTVRMKGNNSNGFSTSEHDINQFQMTGKISASGNIMSLLYEDNFERQLTIPGEYCFYCMFYYCASLTTAPELPATTLANYCYADMFYGCTSLTTAPELPATTLASSCYQYMFYGCTSLNYIKMLATDISGYNCLANWVKGVANTGTFIKHPNMNSLIIGDNGIPDGWSVQDYSI